MSSNHPYSHFRVPKNAPFRLQPSVGKGWGAFATKSIERGAMILTEEPLFVIRKPSTQITEEDVRAAFQQLPFNQKQQFFLVRDNGSGLFAGMEPAFAENSFAIAGPDGIPAYGLLILQSRFNHSCTPNSKVPTSDGQFITRFATRDIAAGEEITFCYETDFECRTRFERHQALRFECDCRACLTGTVFQQCSDLRRRLVRGLLYLTFGVDLDGRKHTCGSPIITNPELKTMAENLSIPLSSRLVYNLLTAALLEQEGLLDHFMIARLRPGIEIIVTQFKTPINVNIVKHAMAQREWSEKFWVAFRLYGQRDVADDDFALLLRHLRPLR